MRICRLLLKDLRAWLREWWARERGIVVHPAAPPDSWPRRSS